MIDEDRIIGKVTSWKVMRLYARKYGAIARGFSATEILEQIVKKARMGRIDLTDEEYEHMLDACNVSQDYRGENRYKIISERTGQ